jgi:hypothetical protein
MHTEEEKTASVASTTNRAHVDSDILDMILLTLANRRKK